MKTDRPRPTGLPLILVPELFRKTGGVQRYSLRFIEALDRIYGEPVPVVSMNDRRSDLPESFLQNRKITPCGKGGPLLRKWRLISATLRAGNSPSILSTHPGPAPWLALWKRFTGKPFLCVAHGIDAWDLSPRMTSALEKSDLLLPVSRFTGDKLMQQLTGYSPACTVLPNMVEAERFHPGRARTDWRSRLSIDAGAKVLLTVCRVSRTESGKGYDLILDSLPDLIANEPTLTWILAGKGDDLPRLREKARRLGVESNCRFPGFVKDEELPDLYRSVDLFVLPSRKEGFGIVFLEAAASGLPVIAGNRDGSTDALAGGALGTLIDPEDPDQLTAAIERSLREKNHSRTSLHHACVARFGRNSFENSLRLILTRHPSLAGGRFGIPGGKDALKP